MRRAAAVPPVPPVPSPLDLRHYAAIALQETGAQARALDSAGRRAAGDRARLQGSRRIAREGVAQLLQAHRAAAALELALIANDWDQCGALLLQVQDGVGIGLSCLRSVAGTKDWSIAHEGETWTDDPE